MSDRIKQYKVGARIGTDLTVLDVVAKVRGRHPVYIVWNHTAWCPMACKVMRSSRRAEREAEVLNAVVHPNIVRSMGTREPALLLLEFLQGPTLESLAWNKADERFSVSDALRAIIHVGSALQHMHGLGYLHLDIKPANVIVSGGRPVLCDFGTARRLGEERPDSVMGTDPYIAPEEAELGEVSAKSDVFGLGVMLYELLTGAYPFPEARRGEPYPQLNRAPTPLRAHRPRVSARLEALVASCLARDPDQRPALADLLPALHGAINSGPAMWPATFAPGSTRPTRKVRLAA